MIAASCSLLLIDHLAFVSFLLQFLKQLKAAFTIQVILLWDVHFTVVGLQGKTSL